MKTKRRSEKLQQKLAQRKDADATRPVTPYMQWADNIRDRLEKARARGIDPHDIFSRGPYRKHDPEHVRIEARKDENVEGKIITVDMYRPIICLRDPNDKQWKEVWRFHTVFHLESEALMTLGRMFTNIATWHSLTQKPEFNHFCERKAQAAERQIKRLEKQAKHIAASKGHNA